MSLHIIPTTLTLDSQLITELAKKLGFVLIGGGG